MSKNAVKPEAPYTEQTSLGGPIPKIGTNGPMPCRLQLSSKILEASGLRANDRIELVAVGDGQILIKKTGAPKPGLQYHPSKNPLMDDLMAFTKAKEAELKEATARRYAPPEPEEEGEDEGGPLNLEQVSGEEL